MKLNYPIKKKVTIEIRSCDMCPNYSWVDSKAKYGDSCKLLGELPERPEGYYFADRPIPDNCPLEDAE